jgi:polyphenol oxidase
MTLEIVTARALQPIRHGFFTRKGGASSGVFEGLNCGVGSSDQSDMVRINRTRVATAMGVAPERLVTLHQVHSADAVVLTGPPDAPIRADAMVTATPGLALAVLTADCQPVLFADAAAGVVGAAHAGWKGALDGVLEATLDAMQSLGADRERTVAVIGPTISQAAYEVGPEFVERFLDADPGERAVLRGEATAIGRSSTCRATGSTACGRRAWARPIWTRHCTYADAVRFFSYRRSVHQPRGGLWSVDRGHPGLRLPSSGAENRALASCDSRHGEAAGNRAPCAERETKSERR